MVEVGTVLAHINRLIYILITLFPRGYLSGQYIFCYAHGYNRCEVLYDMAMMELYTP
jgi:hypothetical protein